MNVPLLPKQLVMLEHPAKVVGARGGVGSGKTLTLAWWILREAYRYPAAAHAVMGASFTQLEKGFFKTLKGRCDKYQIPYTFTTSPRPKLVLEENGAVIESLSAEQRESIRSLEMDRVVLEEPQTWESGRETFLTLVERLRPSPTAVALYPGVSPQIRLSFNPPVVGHWLYELFEKQWAGKYPCFRLSLRENTIHAKVDPDYLPFLLSTLPVERHAREIDGHWGTVATGVYSGFDALKNTIEALRAERPQQPLPQPLPPFAIDPMKPLRYSLDFNVGWMASVVAQIHDQPMVTRYEPQPPPHQPKAIVEPMNRDYQQRVAYFHEEIFLPDAGIPNVIREFLKRFGPIARNAGIILYGDSSGGGRSQTMDSADAARTPWKMVIKYLVEGFPREGIAGIPMNRIEFRVQSRNPPIIDRVYATREWFHHNGAVGFVCSQEKCPELVNDFNLVQWTLGKNEIDKSDRSEDGLKRTHLSDAAGYMLWFEREKASNRDPKLLDWRSR